MPGLPPPVGWNGPLPPWWNAVIQAAQKMQAQANATAGIAAAQGSILLQSAVSPTVFTPTNANDQEAMTSPAVTVNIGTSGKAILIVSSVISVTPAAGNTQLGILYYSWTPTGGTQQGPGSQVIAKFGGDAGTSALSLSSSAMGSVTLSQLPAGNVTFNLWAESATTQGASFTNTELIVWPL